MDQIGTKVPYLLIQEDMWEVVEYSYHNDIKYDCVIFSGIDLFSMIIKRYEKKCICHPSEYRYLVNQIQEIQSDNGLLIWGGYTGDMYVGDSFDGLLKNYELIDKTGVILLVKK